MRNKKKTRLHAYQTIYSMSHSVYEPFFSFLHLREMEGEIKILKSKGDPPKDNNGILQESFKFVLT